MNTSKLLHGKIICAGMNRLSSVKLANACFDSGIVPSLVHINHDFETLLNILNSFKGKLYILCVTSNILTIKVIQKFIELKVPFLEFLDFPNDNLLKILNTTSIGTIQKLKGGTFHNNVDYVTIKTDKAASFYDPKLNVSEYIKKSSTPVIVSGGVYDKVDIAYCLGLGASAVSIGTTFALSEESAIPTSKKVFLINNSNRLVSIPREKHNINCIELNRFSEQDDNFTKNLEYGLYSDKGFVYIGHSIKKIQSIQTVQEISKRLIY